jgi:NADH-quinone oxidoreductase subunit C
LAAEVHRGDERVILEPSAVHEAIAFLKQDPSCHFQAMMDLFALDYLKFSQPMRERYAVVYNLYSMTTHQRIYVKTFLPESKPEVDSIADLYKAANWFEREAWDLFGIVFRGHPNLVRILCHSDFEGHPLRKDYPSDQYQRLKQAAPPSGF